MPLAITSREHSIPPDLSDRFEPKAVVPLAMSGLLTTIADFDPSADVADRQMVGQPRARQQSIESFSRTPP
jgi:hypothetical protein